MPAHVVDVDHGTVGVEVEDLVDRRLEQRVVVADHHEPAAVRLEEVAQPDDRVGVEVVGRLVEQHDLGTGEQDPGQLDATTLAARKRADRLREDPLLDPERGGHLRRLRLGGVAPTGVQLGVGPRPPLHAALVDLLVLAGHVDLGLAEASYDVVEAARRQDAVAGEHLGVTDPRVLRQVADVAAAEHLTGSGLALAGEDAGEGRLAGSVAPHEADLVACGDPEGDVLHEEPRAGSDLELLGGDHLARHPTKGWRREPHPRVRRYCAIGHTAPRSTCSEHCVHPAKGTPMRFNPKARLDTSRVGDGGGGGGGGGGMRIPMPGGTRAGGGIGGLIIVILFVVLTQCVGGGGGLPSPAAAAAATWAPTAAGWRTASATPTARPGPTRTRTRTAPGSRSRTRWSTSGTRRCRSRPTWSSSPRRCAPSAGPWTPRAVRRPRRSGRSTARETRRSTSTPRSSPTCSSSSSAARAATSSSPT